MVTSYVGIAVLLYSRLKISIESSLKEEEGLNL